VLLLVPYHSQVNCILRSPSYVFRVPQARIYSIAFNSSSSLIASVSDHGTLHVHSLSLASMPQAIPCAPLSLIFCPAGLFSFGLS
jgi:hypothetical protein